MKYVIFYDIARITVFGLNKKRNSYFLTKTEAQKTIEEALVNIPRVDITLLKKAKNIRKVKRYYLLSPTKERLEGNQRKLELRESSCLDRRWEGDFLIRNRDFTKDKLIMERIFYQIRVGIKE